VFDARVALAWQPLFGSGLRLDWEQTERLDLREVEMLLARIDEWRGAERRAVFGKK
jgi:hypothetical protein